MINFTKIFAFLLIIFSLGFISRAQETLTILHMNDTHSTLAPIGPRNADLSGTLGGISRAATVIGMNKLTEPNVLTLHAGDFSIGDLFYNKYFGVPELQILQSLGLDALTVGNHEWDLTPAALEGALSAAFPNPSDGFPILSANTDLSDAGLADLTNYIFPYTIKNVGPIKVGIFGMTTPSANLISQPLPAVISEDIFTIAGTMVGTLAANNCDVIIFLSHLGLDLDKLIAENIPGINLIVGGHDHYLINTPLAVANALGTTWIVQANSNYLAVGKVKLRVDNGTVDLISGEVIELNESIPEEPSVKAIVNSLVEDIESFYGIPFYTMQSGYAASFFKDVETDLTGIGAHDTPIGNLVTDAFRWRTGAEIAIQAGGSTALPLYEGPFVPADIYRINGYGFNTINTLGFQIVKFELSGAGLLAGLEFGLSEIELNDEYLLQISGLDYTYDGSLPPYSRITSAVINGNPIDPSSNYTVAANEFALLFLDFLGIPYSVIEFYSGVTEFQALSEYIMAKGPVIYPKSEGRIANLKSNSGKQSVAGAGWFNSPAGSSINHPDFEGRVIFVCNVEQKKNGSLKGNIHAFAPKLHQLFTCENIEWLAVENSSAQVKGTAKLNGQGNYGFLISAFDEENGINNEDKILVKIWDKDTEEVIYSNTSAVPIHGAVKIKEPKISKDFAQEISLTPSEYELSQNYPNPFNPATTFDFRIPEGGLVTLKIYDVLGNEVAVIINEQLSPGSYSYQWNAGKLASGVYIYRLEAGNFISTKKLLLMK